MALPTVLIPIIGKIIEKIIPDKNKQEEAKANLETLEANGELEILAGQLAVNKVEARHKSIFVAGWRPGLGWCGVIAMAYQFVLYPILIWLWQIGVVAGAIPPDIPYPPVMDATVLFTIITGMLGIAGMRSFDKMKGTQTDNI